MPTDNERREAARRLRGLEVCELDGEFIDCGEVEGALGLVSDDGVWYEAEGVMRLADLIEPSGHECVPGECPINVRHDNDRIDRDALLALADEIEFDGGGALDDGDWCKPLLIEYARRIREAVGA